MPSAIASSSVISCTRSGLTLTTASHVRATHFGMNRDERFLPQPSVGRSPSAKYQMSLPPHKGSTSEGLQSSHSMPWQYDSFTQSRSPFPHLGYTRHAPQLDPSQSGSFLCLYGTRKDIPSVTGYAASKLTTLCFFESPLRQQSFSDITRRVTVFRPSRIAITISAVNDIGSSLGIVILRTISTRHRKARPTSQTANKPPDCDSQDY